MFDLKILGKIKEYLSDYHLEYPKIKTTSELIGFTKQECDMEEFDFEMLNQMAGGGITGDSYAGTIAFPINVDQFLAIDYCV